MGLDQVIEEFLAVGRNSPPHRIKLVTFDETSYSTASSLKWDLFRGRLPYRYEVTLFRHDYRIFVYADLDGRMRKVWSNSRISHTLIARRMFRNLNLRLWYPSCNFKKYYYVFNANRDRVPRYFSGQLA